MTTHIAPHPHELNDLNDYLAQVERARQRQLDSLPTDPKNGGPWVMFKGTPYAHIMVPIEPMVDAKTAAAH